MNKHLITAVSMVFFASTAIATSASAQEKTRAEVHQELIQAENNGSRFVTDTSYPDVNPMFAQQVAHARQGNDGVGSEASAPSAAGAPNAPAPVMNKAGSNCVGPVSYCMLYFGS
jgi:hypothetical protein